MPYPRCRSTNDSRGLFDRSSVSRGGPSAARATPVPITAVLITNALKIKNRCILLSSLGQ